MFTRLAANWRTLRAIGPWARPHRRVLAWTMLATVGVVLLRLAFPWPLRGVLEIASGTAGTAGHHDRSIAQLVPAGIDGVLAFGVAYLVVSICVGIAELVQRVRAKRYTTRVVNDLRGSALIGAVRSQRPQRTGELIARIIGDAARIREGLSGVLVHLTQNSLLFAGMAVLLLIVSPSLGVLLIGAGLLAVLIGIFASSLTTDVATRHREKEGSFAHQIQHSIDHGEVHHKSERTNAQSGKNDVEATRLIGATCLLIHIVMGATVAIGLSIGASEVQSGSLAPGELFLFVAYCLTMHYRSVHMGRQLARMGKVFACMQRLIEVAREGRTDAADRLGDLASGLHLRHIEVESDRDDRLRLDIASLDIAPGSHVAIVGAAGAGKSTLLHVLAGSEAFTRGELLWNDTPLAPLDPRLVPMVMALAHQPQFPARRVWQLLHMADRDARPDGASKKWLKRTGALALVRGLQRKYRARVSSASLSAGEARCLGVASAGLDSRPVLMLDDPWPGERKRDVRRRLKALRPLLGGRTLLVAMRQPVALEQFDRVIELLDGRVISDGPPAGAGGAEAVAASGAATDAMVAAAGEAP